MKNNFPRTVIYCNSIQDVSNLYFYLTTESEELKNMIEMYHSETPAEKKENIVQKLGKDSDLKIVIATSALGMGIDVKHCHSVILYGPPKEIVDLLQETGRCGRDGEKSVAVIMCNRYQLGHVSSEVKNVVKSTDCRRTAILQHFVNNNDFSVGDLHSCCDLCAEKCPCGACEVLELEKLMNPILNETDLTDDLSSSSDTVSYEYESDLDTGLF
jgi:superfamily II DNA helicase RecQ